MKTHFGETFQLLTPGEFSLWRNLPGHDNIWRRFDQVVCPVDAVKPLDRRRGWSRQQVDEYNQDRLGDLLDAGFDLVICDESHRLSGSTERVARYRLARALADAAPYLLLLSATPHQGKSPAFQRLMSLLDKEEFIVGGSASREKVVPFVIRTEKCRAINERGEPLFQPRLTKLVPVSWDERHRLQKQLYESVTEYVRLGYNQALRQNRQYLGFLMILMQRQVTSSTRAIASALERRLEVLQATSVLPAEEETLDPDWAEQDGQEQLEELLAARLVGLQNEKEEVRLLLDLARRCQAQGPDARAEALLGLLYETQGQENDPDLKFLIFTEFVPTQEMLREFLDDHGFSVTCLNGSMGLDQRRRVQRQFAEKARILVSTDAGGEGLNLQFAHVIVNYDLPWNPMRIEQRIGRVDRIGQKHPVRAFNLIFEESVERRVQEVLQEKLQTILEDFGVDKTEDVLDSAEGGSAFEKLYAEAIMNPGAIEASVGRLVQQVREQAEEEKAGRSLYGDVTLDPALAQQLSSHPLPYWVERMIVSYLRSHGGKVQRSLFGYALEWPDGSRLERVSFHGREAQDRGLPHLSLEDARVRGLVQRLPRAVPGQPLPRVRIEGIPPEIHGLWSLWRISLGSDHLREVKVLPLFRHDDGRTFQPTARMLWDRFLEEQSGIRSAGVLTGEEATAAFAALRDEAERQGRAFFEELQGRKSGRVGREREKGRYAFGVRREAINRLGLAEVRQHRLRRLEEEERAWAAELDRQEQILPELSAVIIVRVDATDGKLA
jgi:ERCC4-related helicase